MSSNGHDHTDRQKYVPRETVARWLQRARETRKRYFIFFRDFFLIMGKLEALILQDLINRAAIAEDKHRVKDGYFRCTIRYLEKAGWSEREQRTYLRPLIKAGFVKTKRQGLGALRWMKIDYPKLEEALDDAIFSDTGELRRERHN